MMVNQVYISRLFLLIFLNDQKQEYNYIQATFFLCLQNVPNVLTWSDIFDIGFFGIAFPRVTAALAWSPWSLGQPQVDVGRTVTVGWSGEKEQIIFLSVY